MIASLFLQCITSVFESFSGLLEMAIPFKKQVGHFKNCSWCLPYGRIAVQICVQYLC